MFSFIVLKDLLQRVFLYDTLNRNTITSERVTYILRSMFPLFYSDHSSPNELLSFVENSVFDDMDKNSFDFDFNFFSNVSVSTRLSFNQSIYISKNYNLLGKKSSDFVIKYSDGSSFSFGFVYYFLKFENTFKILLSELQLLNFILSNIRGLMPRALQRLKNMGYFRDYFFHVRRAERLFLIDASQILSKCIVFNIDQENYIVSEFIMTEHD